MIIFNDSRSPLLPVTWKKTYPSKNKISINKMPKKNRNKIITKHSVEQKRRIKPRKITKSNKKFLQALGFKI